MSGTQLSGDTRYLFRRDKTWWVKLAVPRQLRDSLGYDLRRSLRTRDLNEARQARWEAIEEFRSKIDKAKAAQAAASSGAAATAAVEGDDVARSADGPQRIGEHIVEIVSDSGEGAQKCGQIMGLVSGKMGNGVWTVEIIPAEIQPPARERQGASGYLTKPVKEAELVAAIDEALGG
mgnify:CR=1 FL=1